MTRPFWDGGAVDTFAAQIEGQVSVEEGGSYTFFISGDDGAILYVNGEPLINNDGDHGYQTFSGAIDLEPGIYDIEVRYFENYGQAGLKLEWDGPDTDGRELVQADAETVVEQNGTLEVGIEITGASDAATVEVTGIPADTILISGDNSAVADGESVDLTGWDIGLLEISPPPEFEGIIEGEIVVSDTGFNGADVSSANAFSITVGDAEFVSDDEMQGLDGVLLDTQLEAPTADLGWDAALSEVEEGQEQEQDSDVMAEVTVVDTNYDVPEVNMETYERADW